MGKHVALSEAKPGVTLWTPWGEQQAFRPGEKFAALRKLVKRIDRRGKAGKPAPAQIEAITGN